MHAIFSHLDVVTEIAAAVSTKATLVSLARTCKSLNEPALNRVWREMDSLLPLFACMPDDVWVWEQRGWASQSMSCNRMPYSEKDWTRFNLYAPRIKGLHLTATEGRVEQDSFNSFVEELQFSRPGEYRPFLPNLVSLSLLGEWNEGEEFFPLLHTLLCPTLRRLDIDLPHACAIAVTALSPICQSCPDLEDLSIGDLQEVDPSQLCSRFPALHSLRYKDDPSSNVETLHPLSFRALAQLKNLHTLDIGPHDLGNACKELGKIELDVRSSHGIFPALQDVSFGSVYEIEELAAFLRLITTHSLRVFAATLGCSTTDAQLGVLADALALHPSLEVVELTDASDWKPQRGSPSSMTVSGLTSLQQLTKLREVRLVNMPGAPSVTDTHLGALTKNWQHLESFTYYMDPAKQKSYRERRAANLAPPSKLTPAVLESFAAHCPALVKLQLPLDLSFDTLRVIYETQSQTNIGSRQWTPLVLTVHGDATPADIGSARCFGELISDVYPHITARPGHTSRVQKPKYWDAVWSAVKMLRSVRERERKRVDLGVAV